MKSIVLILAILVPTACKRSTASHSEAPPKPAPARQVRTYSEKEAAAGKVFLQTILNPDTTAASFQQTLTPLLTEKQWVFTGDDPTLYLIHGTRGKVGDTTSKSDYVMSLGHLPKITEELISQTNKDMEGKNEPAAAAKVHLLLGCSNRIAFFPISSGVSTILVVKFEDLAIGMLKAHPELQKRPEIRAELTRALGNSARIKGAWDDEAAALRNRITPILDALHSANAEQVKAQFPEGTDPRTEILKALAKNKLQGDTVLKNATALENWIRKQSAAQ